MAVLISPRRQVYGHKCTPLTCHAVPERQGFGHNHESPKPFDQCFRCGGAMNLPKADQGAIHPNKILRYLLDPANPASRGKPALFMEMGYSRLSWGCLSDDLLAHGRSYPVSTMTMDDENRSRTYTIDGELVGPNGRVRRIRTVWRIDEPDGNPRLITAFPTPKARLTIIEGGSDA